MTTPKTPEGWQPTNVFQAFMTAAQEIIDHNHRELVSDWLTRAWHHKVLPALAPTAPAGGEAPAEASDAQLMIVAQEMGLWCEAYTAPRESGIATELDITPEDAAEFNAASLKDIRAALKAAGLYTHPSADLRGAAEQALDAARYRFLRDVAHPDTNSGLRCVGNCADGGEPLHIGGRDLDRAVDAAIASLEAAISRKGKTEHRPDGVSATGAAQRITNPAAPHQTAQGSPAPHHTSCYDNLPAEGKGGTDGR